MVRHDNAQILVEADASDPTATGSAIAALAALPTTALSRDLIGVVALAASKTPFTAVVHSRYNPEAITSYNIVPGLLGTVLSMTLVFMTAQSLAKEREVGTLEGLLATPVRPVEVLVGKLAPYVGIGILQTGIILLLARALFDVPEAGGWDALAIGVVLFIVGSLALGFLISTFAHTQQEAQLWAQFYFMPSFRLSGFFFPFAGMPGWAQVIGSLVPVTHFLRIVRGSLLKGQGNCRRVAQPCRAHAVRAGRERAGDPALPHDAGLICWRPTQQIVTIRQPHRTRGETPWTIPMTSARIPGL